jgi:hypothetical protein
MLANREQIEHLVAAAPNFRTRWERFLKDSEDENVPPWFVGISELAHYLVESYAEGVTGELPRFFSTVETLLENADPETADPETADPETEDLIAVGLFEDIQNIASHRDFGPAPFRRLLGPRSLVVWDEVDAYMKRVAEWTVQNQPRWWQFWRRRAFDAKRALAQVESPELRKIIEANYRKMS